MTKNKIMLKAKGFDAKGRSFEEVDAIVKRMKQPDYHRKSRGLTPGATQIDRAKYKIQQNILGYVQDNNISEQELKKILEIKEKRRLECLLFAHIENFSLDELFAYAEKLTIPLQVVNNNEEKVSKKNVSTSHHVSLSAKSSNGRLKKHL